MRRPLRGSWQDSSVVAVAEPATRAIAQPLGAARRPSSGWVAGCRETADERVRLDRCLIGWDARTALGDRATGASRPPRPNHLPDASGRGRGAPTSLACSHYADPNVWRVGDGSSSGPCERLCCLSVAGRRVVRRGRGPSRRSVVLRCCHRGRAASHACIVGAGSDEHPVSSAPECRDCVGEHSVGRPPGRCQRDSSGTRDQSGPAPPRPRHASSPQ